MTQHPARLRITEPEDVFLALTSYPPGDAAPEVQLTALRDAIAEVFQTSNGGLDVGKESGLFISQREA
jgi:hypothetical protein